MRRIEAQLAEVQIATREITVPDEISSHLRLKTIHDMLSTEPIHHYTPRVRFFYPGHKKSRARWHFIAIAGHDDVLGDRYITDIPASMLTEQNAIDLCGRLVDFLNRYPTLEHASTTNPPPFTGRTDFFQLAHANRCIGMMNVIFDSITSQPPFNLVAAPKVVLLPSLNIKHDEVGLRVRVKHFDSTDGRMIFTTYNVKIINFDARYDAVLPSPDLVRFMKTTHGHHPWSRDLHLLPTRTEADGSCLHDLQAVLPPNFYSSLEGQEEGVREHMKLVMVVSAQLHGTMLPRSMFSSQFAFLLARLGFGSQRQKATTMRRNKWWGGRDFLRVQRYSKTFTRHILISASKRLSQDVVKGTLPILTLPSIDMARAIPVIDACTNVLRQTKDPRKAFLAAAKAIEQQKRNIYQGIPSSNVCRCVPGDLSVACVHHCGACGGEFDGTELSMGIEGTRVCQSCAEEEAKAQVSGPIVMANHSFYTGLAWELKQQGMSMKDKFGKSLFEEGKADLRSRFTNMSSEFLDEYRQQPVQLLPEGEVRRYLYYPLKPSVDAVWPYVDSKYDLRLKHVPGNLTITLPPENFAKFVHPPVILQHIQAYVLGLERLSTDNEGQSPGKLGLVPALENRIIEECSTITKIAVKAKLLLKYYVRTGKPDAQRLALDKQEWVTGRLRSEAGPWNSEKFLVNISRGRIEGFSETRMGLIRSLIGKIEQEFQVTLSRSRDGCPWFAHDSAIPQHWSWTHACREISMRLYRMRETCNGLDITIDTLSSLWVEIIFQECARRCTRFVDGFWSAADKQAWHAEYQEFLRLPLVCQLRWHPLSLSVGHKFHGRQMRTGWSPSPTTLADRNNAHNNILVETSLSNRLKSNFATRHYQFLREIIRTINLSEGYYDPNGPLDPIPDHLRIQWDGEEIEDIEFEDEISAIYSSQPLDLVSDGDLSDEALSDTSSEIDVVVRQSRQRRGRREKIVPLSDSDEDPSPSISRPRPEPAPPAPHRPTTINDVLAISKRDFDFPHGYDIIPTSAEGMYCTFFSFIESIKAQHPAVLVPDVRHDLIPMLSSSDMEAEREILNACKEYYLSGSGDPKSREAHETNQGHLLIDHAFRAIYLWYQKTHKIDLAFGLLREQGDAQKPRPPEIYETDTTSDSTLFVWIYCDMAYENFLAGLTQLPREAVVFSHFSGVRKKGPPTPEPPRPLVAPPKRPRKIGFSFGPPEAGENVTLMMSPKKGQSAAAVKSKFGSVGKAGGKLLTAAQLRGEGPGPSGSRSPSFMQPTKASMLKAAPVLVPRRPSRLGRIEIPETDDEAAPEATAAKEGFDELYLRKIREPDQMPAAEGPQSSGADVGFPETGGQVALATPGAGKKRRQPDDQEVVPTPTRLVKSKQDPVRRPGSPSGTGVHVLGQLPRPASRIEDITLIPTLRARAISIMDEMFSISLDCLRIPEVRDGVSALWSEAYRGNITGFREVLDGLRTVLGRPELGEESES